MLTQIKGEIINVTNHEKVMEMAKNVAVFS